MHKSDFPIILIILLLIITTCARYYPGDAELRFEKFCDPPDESKIWAYWWWHNSMVTSEAITRDLVEMKDKGYGGAIIFDASSSSYNTIVKNKPGPAFGSDEWKDLLAHTVSVADSLGIELSLSISSGWNLGGPQVLPSESQKKMVYSEIEVQGPSLYKDSLPVPVHRLFYKDVAVQAIPDNKPAKDIKYFMEKSLNGQFGARGIYPLFKLRELNHADSTKGPVSSDSIVDLSVHFVNGILSWDIPPGKWKIIRYGMTSKGVYTSTSSDNATGLSLDHMSKDAFRNYFTTVVIPLIETSQSAGNSLKYLYSDSWEMGTINWTQDFEDFFKEKRGYDPVPYLTVMTNRVVDNIEVSNRFLYDLRKTVSDAIYENHYVYFKKLAKEYGLGIHPESGGPHSAPIDAIKIMGNNDFPMGEFWARNDNHRIADEERLYVKQSASVAHVYGKKIVAAEGPTTIGPHWERAPRDLKSVIDRVFCSGMNRLVWHTFTCSPQEFGKPGIEYFAGTHLNPNVTWWEESTAFIKYINRCGFLLSAGKQVADILIYYGDDVPNFVFLAEQVDSLPSGYDYDKCDAQAILNRLSVKDRKIILPDGMEYKILMLPNEGSIDIEVLRKIEELVRKGMIIYGPKPEKSTGLKNYHDTDNEVREIAKRMWGEENQQPTIHKYGKGMVLSRLSFIDLLSEIDVDPDIECSDSNAHIDYIHRVTNNEHIYFIANPYAYSDHLKTEYRYRTDSPDYFREREISFRVSGLYPEIWDPVKATRYKVTDYTEKDGRTKISVLLEPEGSLFVIFRESIDNSLPDYHEAIYMNVKNSRDISAEWDLLFADGYNTPGSLSINELKALTEFENENIKYYSGHTIYSKTVELSEDELAGISKVELDLGQLFELAEITVNGKNAGIVWKYPFRIDISSFLESGWNVFEINVVNLWCNRLILDGKLPANERLTKTNVTKFNRPDADKYLRRSGLVGPVRLLFY